MPGPGGHGGGGGRGGMGGPGGGHGGPGGGRPGGMGGPGMGRPMGGGHRPPPPRRPVHFGGFHRHDPYDGRRGCCGCGCAAPVMALAALLIGALAMLLF